MPISKSEIQRLVALARTSVYDLLGTVTIAPQSGLNDYGEPTVGTAVSYKAFISRKQRKVMTANGAEVVSNASILIPQSASVSVTDKITMPDGKTPPILSVEAALDPDGNPYALTIYV